MLVSTGSGATKEITRSKKQNECPLNLHGPPRPFLDPAPTSSSMALDFSRYSWS